MSTNKKFLVIHIYTDIKFIHGVNRFSNGRFDNKVIVIGSDDNYNGEFKSKISYYSHSRKEFQRIIKQCENAHLVVMNNLNFPKSYIANRLSKSVIVLWRFFGSELYSKVPEHVFSKKTMITLEETKNKNLYSTLINKVKRSLITLKYRSNPSEEIKKAAFNRVDYFICQSEIEYNFLKNKWPKLAPFIQLNFPKYNLIKPIKPSSNKLVILGNNRSAYNNHLDIIELIKESKINLKGKFILMFNYGQKNNYTNIVRTKAAEVEEIEILDKFLSIEKFNQTYEDSDAFVMNGYRQMAMGNIWIAIKQNTKIYLNEKNLVYHWLKKEGFLIFSTNEFIHDLETNTISLNEEQAYHNQNQMISFTEKYNQEIFHNTILKVLDKKATIYHIHTDVKFINEVRRFYSPKFNNQIIILGKNKRYSGPFKDQIQYFDYTRKEFHKIIGLCKTSDIVVLYGLNFQKSYIANRLPKSVKVIWRFFGSELYNLIPEFVFSKKTLCILDEEKSDGFILAFKKWLRVFSIQIKYRAIVKTEIKKAAFQRTDIFLGIFKNEYEFLKNKWPELPPYMQIGIPTIKSSHCYNPKASNKIILGNNRSAYNNHLDILDCIDQAENKNKYKFLMFYNYGFNNHYTETVRNRAAKIKEVEVIEDFMSLDKFKAIHEEADAFVMNGRRQMALGNVWEAIQRNTKLYLNEKNITYTTLFEEGFVVFTIKDFIRDIENNAIKLTAEESIINQKNLQLFSKKYDVKNFHCSIENLIDQKL